MFCLFLLWFLLISFMYDKYGLIYEYSYTKLFIQITPSLTVIFFILHFIPLFLSVLLNVFIFFSFIFINLNSLQWVRYFGYSTDFFTNYFQYLFVLLISLIFPLSLSLSLRSCSVNKYIITFNRLKFSFEHRLVKIVFRDNK